MVRIWEPSLPRAVAWRLNSTGGSPPARWWRSAGWWIARSRTRSVQLRYIINLEPLASASVEEVVAAVAPTVQRNLTAELNRSPADKQNHRPYSFLQRQVDLSL
jgi:Tetracyclin repressor-like, C-terminal domain